MPLDAICLSAVVNELQSLVGGKVDKVFMPEKDELGLAIRSSMGNVRLLISITQGSARLHLTSISRANPQTPPMFCMLLRKHLVGGRITDIMQPPNERIVQLHFDVTDEMGERVKRILAVELMGNNTNIVLIDSEGRIIDCVKRVEGDAKRPVLPGLFYRLPEARQGLGLSPLISRELEYQGISLDILEMRVKENDFTPVMLLEGDKPKDFSFMQIKQYEGLYTARVFEGFSEMLDTFYTQRDVTSSLQRRASGLRKIASNALERTRRKLVLQNEEYAATLNRERLRQFGDLLMANLGNISRGDSTALVQDFYGEDGAMVDIKLNVTLSPQQNAAKYYKEYTKAKNAQEMLSKMFVKGEQDIEYLESVMDSLDKIRSEQDIEDIRDELEHTGLLPKSKGKKKISKPAQPLTFRSDSGVTIYVGRNNRQNDELTLKTAAKTDTWLHTQKIAGSHVIISCKGETLDDATLEQAAILAATFSQGKKGQKVPVDYTLVKYVKKAAGGKPGLVIYDKFKTVFVDPSEELAKRLAKT